MFNDIDTVPRLLLELSTYLSHNNRYQLFIGMSSFRGWCRESIAFALRNNTQRPLIKISRIIRFPSLTEMFCCLIPAATITSRYFIGIHISKHTAVEGEKEQSEWG